MKKKTRFVSGILKYLSWSLEILPAVPFRSWELSNNVIVVLVWMLSNFSQSSMSMLSLEFIMKISRFSRIWSFAIGRDFI
jgi:hypothetical protein